MSKIEKVPNEISAGPDSFREELKTLARAEHADPFRILGPHWTDRPTPRSLVIRSFRPGAVEASIVWSADGTPYPAEQIHAEGVFEATIPTSAANLVIKIGRASDWGGAGV